MELWFINIYREDRCRKIADVDTTEEYWKVINNFMDERNFKSYYQRLWVDNNELWNDVGSHTEFFVLKEPSVDFLRNLLGDEFKWE